MTKLNSGISLCMIVKNEQYFIESCLKSISSYVNEICIIDTGSTDNTLRLIYDFSDKNPNKIKLKQISWNDNFAEARNVSLEMATYNKILILDADETVVNTECLSEEFKKLPTNNVGMVNFYNLDIDGQYEKYTTYEHKSIRMFHNGLGIKFHGRVHEYPLFPNEQSIPPHYFTNITINHYGYDDKIMKSKNKYKRNMELLLQYSLEEPLNAYAWYNLGLAQINDTSLKTGLPNNNSFYDLEKGIRSLENSKELQLEEKNKGTYYNNLEKYLNRAKKKLILIGKNRI